MSDERLRDLQRREQSLGDRGDRLRFLHEKQRAGQIEAIEAARLGELIYDPDDATARAWLEDIAEAYLLAGADSKSLAVVHQLANYHPHDLKLTRAFITASRLPPGDALSLTRIINACKCEDLRVRTYDSSLWRTGFLDRLKSLVGRAPLTEYAYGILLTPPRFRTHDPEYQFYHRRDGHVGEDRVRTIIDILGQIGCHTHGGKELVNDPSPLDSSLVYVLRDRQAKRPIVLTYLMDPDEINLFKSRPV